MEMQYIDVLGSIPGFSIVDTEPKLEEYYKLLHCDLIDMPIYEVDGHKFIVICDDEGALKDNKIMSGINPHNQPLFGNLLICGMTHGEDGIEERGLNDGEKAVLRQRFGMTEHDGKRLPCIDLRRR